MTDEFLQYKNALTDDNNVKYCLGALYGLEKRPPFSLTNLNSNIKTLFNFNCFCFLLKTKT